MASFQSTITEQGIEHLTRLFVTGKALLLTRAEIGDGRMAGAQNQASAPAHPLTADVQIGEKNFIESTPSYLLLPIYVSNKELRTAIYIREVMLYGQEEDGTEFPFAYAWLDGEDTDNILPAANAADGSLDTVHIHEIALLMTDQMQAAIRIEVSGGNWITAAQMEAYALKKPKEDGENGCFLQKTETGTKWTDILPAIEAAGYLTDDLTGKKYRLGISGGALYYEEKEAGGNDGAGEIPDTDSFATDEEVQEMLDEIFGS